MRPHRLDFTAIGSFPGDVSVDFDALAPYGLFHIHGATGAGKSSLIDAICFALYGTVPSPRRADALRSHHAEPTVEAVVRFEFSAQEATWRIVRTPAQSRAKLRGTGTTEQRPTATLQRKQGGGWAPVAAGVKEVDPIIQQLLGLDADQFMQVVVLPQGGFQRALRAGSDERAKLLRDLFGTQRFEVYVARLKERADSIRQRFDRQKATVTHHATRVRDQTDALGVDVAWNDDGYVDDDVLASIDAAKKTVLQQAKRAHAIVEATAVEAEASEQKLREAMVDAERWQRKVGAETRLASLAAEQPEIDLVRHELDLAEKARPLEPLQRALTDSERRTQAATTTREVVQTTLRTAMHRLPGESDLQLQLTAIAEGRPALELVDSVRRTVRSHSTDVQVLADQIRQAGDARADTADRRASLDQLTVALQASAEQLRAVDAAIAEAEEALESDQPLAARFETLRADIDDLSAGIDAAKSLATQRRVVADMRTTLYALDEAALGAQRAHLELLERRINGMAGELATKLIDGDPCTVCGSPEHPAPAPSHDTVDRTLVEAAAAKADQASVKAAEARAALEVAQKQEAQLTGMSGAVCDDLESAEQRMVDLLAERDQAEAAGVNVRQLTHKLQTLSESRQQILATQNDTAQLVATTQSLADEADQRAAELERRAGTLDGNVVDLLHALEHVHDTLDAYSHALVEETSRQHAFESAQSELQQCASKAKITDVGAALQAIRSDDQRKVLAQRLAAWDDARINALATLADSTIASLQTAPDIADAQASQQLANQRHREALQLAAKIETDADHLSRSIDLLRTEHKKLRPIEEEHERVGGLAELCAGGQRNTKRLSLERYILAAYLEEVATAAGKRLHLMSAGRYRLRHTDARVRGNAASGLSLLVTDAYTGQEREVSTLSGGETFLASLALALGLADVVQGKSGGVHIDALFIDEGFGSLDPEALELAMAELDRLREGGRLVGVISHVPTLRERIPAGIEVVAGPSGSTVRQTGALAEALA